MSRRQKSKYGDALIGYADDGLPIFKVVPEDGPFKYPARPDGTRAPDGCHLVFKCPKCKAINVHGGVYKQKGGGDGHRVEHCNCWPNGYYLREV